MRGVPKIVLERLKGRAIANQDNRQSPIGNRQSAVGNRQFDHPDANLLTAFVERTLTEGERAQVLNHLAGCAECREVVALTLPAAVEAAEPARLPGRPVWGVRPALRWVALATVLGAAIVLVVLRTHSTKKPEMAAKNVPTAVVAVASNPPPQPLAQVPGQTSLNAAAATTGARPQGSPRQAVKLEKLAAPPRHPVIAVRPAGAELKTQATVTAATPPPAAAGGVPAETQSLDVSAGVNTGLAGSVSTPGAPLNRTLVSRSERRGLTSGVVAAGPLRAKALQAKLPGMAFRSESQNAAGQPGALWAISPEGKLQRSGDGGKSWEEVRVDNKVTFRAIQATGKEIWAGGTEGALYHSSDSGATWTRVNLSSGGATATQTIVSINCSATDPQHITVITEAGEKWTSEDGGQHWSLTPGA